MQIDWITFVAQVFNFVLLVYLLKRFLYGPIMEAVDRREEQIRDRLEAAGNTRENAERERIALEARSQELEAGRVELLDAAQAEAEERRKELTLEVREQVEKARDDWRQALRRQEASFLSELRRRVGEEIQALTGRVLSELADADLEERVIGVFLSRLEGAEDAERRQFLDAVRQADGMTRVRTAFPLDDARRGAIRRAASAWVGEDLDIDFQEDPSLALGIEMRAGDRKVAWSVDSYLDRLQFELSGYFDSELG